MKVKRSADDLMEYLKDSIVILESSIKDYNNGEMVAYRNIANQLRMLLCDTKGGKPNALLPKLFSDIKLHPLTFQLEDKFLEQDGHKLGFFISGPLRKENGIVRLPRLFNLKADPIPLNCWLDQCIIAPEITLRNLIKSVVEKNGGAHIDEIINEVIVKAEFLHLKGIECKAVYISEIGRFILAEVKKLNEKESK